MDLGPGSYGFGFLAGVLSLLSPCVLPLVPIVVGTAVAAHPLGAFALLGALMLVLGILILTGRDKSLEAFLVSVSPAWLTALTTKF